MTSLYSPTATDVKQRLRPFGFFFEKSLKDLITGIRSHNDTPEKLDRFLSEILRECREEANSADLNLKTNAILKLTYLEMYGFDMSWCNFHILEIMSSNKLQQKRVGYLAASQSFYKDPDILMLATNLLKKDLKYSGNNDVVKVGIALSGLSAIVTPTLAADIADDLFAMLNSSKPYIRKKAVTALFKVFLQYPEALRDNFDKFALKLEDEDTTVVSATVSVICELSKKNPTPFIQLSPMLYELLINIDNNWIIIRLLKLFTNLSQVEPKLRPKLLPKILELMEATVATSVLYESINCIVKGDMLINDDYDTAMYCLDHLEKFCNSKDPNLRYISCILFYKIGKINTNFISRFSNLVLHLLVDVDISIRSRAIELLQGIVSQDNLKKIVTTLMKQFVSEDTIVLQDNPSTFRASREIQIFVPDSYKVKLVDTIITLCSSNNYANVSDFEWLNAVLLDLATISQDLPDAQLGLKLGKQFRTIMVKIPSMRSVIITSIINLIADENISIRLPSVLEGCIWSLGEFSNVIENGDALVKLLIRNGHSYSSNVQQVLIPALVKIFSNWVNRQAEPDMEIIKILLHELVKFFEVLSSSKYFEVQERSVEATEILRLISDAITSSDEELPLLLTEVLPSLFNTYELKPISEGQQKLLTGNINIDLETPFLTQEELEDILRSSEDSHTLTRSLSSLLRDSATPTESEREDEYKQETSPDSQNALSTGQRKKDRLSNPFYLDHEESLNTNADDEITNAENAQEHDDAKHKSKSKKKGEKKKKKKIDSCRSHTRRSTPADCWR
ncbi:hypothetical protein NCAS_0A01160 [Naumovozyma castellii]|uniref:AP-3 complex subunit delta n=1 Tax=Naumovozyma castellii TaxID=27288 RepID=G0V5E0_NAUCA|nr:hypothetical protein NCAS_0A01160 [Naumovozyma castellii CBS 4309]CCC66676.1 hypothetical protein NCAS_0A01160 [Naumovozyma castellii CBS 4309]